MKVTVIVPCRNEKRHIREFLDSLLAQEIDRGWELEILVADGLSDDGTREILREYARNAPQVRMIDNPGRIVSTGLNAAIQASSGEVIIRTDAHTVYAKDYLKECVRTLERTGADNVGGPWVARGEGIVGKAIAAAFHSRVGGGAGRSHDPNYEGEVDTVYLGCWPRSAFEKAGLFDPALVRNQDDEFNFRIRRMGGRVWQSPRIKSIYTPRASLKALFRQYLQYGYWKVAVIRKHGAVASWRHLAPGLLVLSLAVLALTTIGAAMIGGIHFAQWPAIALAVELLLYAAICVGAAVPFLRSEPLRVVLLLPVVVMIYHVSYGLGFLLGWITRLRTGTANDTRPRFLTALTR